MSQDDPQQPERPASPRISRDTLLLLGALAFLIFAVALTFLFTPGAEGPTEVAGGTATPETPAPADTAVAGYPSPSEPTVPPAGGAITSTPDMAYPGPGDVNGEFPGADSSTPTMGVPSFGTPGQEEFGTPGVEPSPEDSFDDETPDPEASPTEEIFEDEPNPEDPYPLPEGQPPAQPTFNPTRVQPTTPPPPAIPTTAPLPTAFQQPTSAPPPTPTEELEEEPTDEPVAEPTATPAVQPPGLPPTSAVPLPPPPPPADVLRGNVRWAAGQSPIVLQRDVQIAPGAELIIEPGVEVRIDPGVSIYVDGGRLLALGLPGNPVRFVGNTGARWSGIYGLPNSYVAMEHTEIRGGGVGGTVMAIERGELVMRSSKVNDNGGAILLVDTKLEMLDSEIAGNDMPYGAALDTSYSRGNFVVLRRNRIGGNILSEGAPMVRVANQSTIDTLNLEISGNLMRGGEPNLQLSTNGPLKGSVDCNALVGEGLGLGLRTQTVQVGPNGSYTMDLRVRDNFIDEHTPPIIPIYLKYGLGRGAASEILIDMRNNWWGDPSGPYEPDENALGRGDSVGENITFAPWLTAPPACAPSR